MVFLIEVFIDIIIMSLANAIFSTSYICTVLMKINRAIITQEVSTSPSRVKEDS